MNSPYINDLETRFRAAFDAGLAKHGVKWPEQSAHKWGLMFLFENIGAPCSQDAIADFYARNNLGRYDRQLRHRARDGWPLITSQKRATNMFVDESIPPGHLMMRSMDLPNPKGHANRSGAVKIADWDEKVKLFEKIRGGCAVCGEKQTSYDKGHLDRDLGMVIENIVPMCTECNNYGQAYNFDFKMHPKSLKVRPVPRNH